MDNARVYEEGEGGRRKVAWSLCLLFIASREGKGGGEGLSLVVTCSGYFESNKSTLSVYWFSVLRVCLVLIPLSLVSLS